MCNHLTAVCAQSALQSKQLISAREKKGKKNARKTNITEEVKTSKRASSRTCFSVATLYIRFCSVPHHHHHRPHTRIHTSNVLCAFSAAALIYGCPFCGVRFSSPRTLQGHLSYYCSKKRSEHIVSPRPRSRRSSDNQSNLSMQTGKRPSCL